MSGWDDLFLPKYVCARGWVIATSETSINPNLYPIHIHTSLVTQFLIHLMCSCAGLQISYTEKVVAREYERQTKAHNKEIMAQHQKLTLKKASERESTRIVTNVAHKVSLLKLWCSMRVLMEHKCCNPYTGSSHSPTYMLVTSQSTQLVSRKTSTHLLQHLLKPREKRTSLLLLGECTNRPFCFSSN